MVLRAIGIGVLATYPILIYFGIQTLPAGFFGLLLAVLVMLRIFTIRGGDRLVVLPLMALLLVYSVAVAFFGSTRSLLYYPVLVNVALCVAFSASLLSEDPLLLRFVRSRGVAMSEYAAPYLTRLTRLWASFFAISALVALWTTTASLEVWTVYNGFVSYLLVAALISAEWLYRRRYKRVRGVGDL